MACTISILENENSNYIKELARMQKLLLPEYDWNPANMLKIRYDTKRNRPVTQTIMGFCDNVLAGFAHLNFIYVKKLCFIEISLIGVLPEYRRKGLALELFDYIKKMVADFDKTYNYRIAGILGLAVTEYANDDFPEKRLFLYKMLGAQIRKDIIFKTPDYPDSYVLWLPAQKYYSKIRTPVLSWLLWSIMEYTNKQFRKYMGKYNVRKEIKQICKQDIS